MPTDPHRSLRAVIVDNPYYSPAHAGARPKQIDAAQVVAATKFRALWEAMGVRLWDGEPVAGGRVPIRSPKGRSAAGKETGTAPGSPGCSHVLARFRRRG